MAIVFTVPGDDDDTYLEPVAVSIPSHACMVATNRHMCRICLAFSVLQMISLKSGYLK